jgi:nitrite reductase (NADH) small subunit
MAKSLRIAQTSDLSPGECKSVEVEGRTIALFNVEGTLYAIDGNCSHVGGPLGEGALDGEVVTCPWHGAQFNVRTGTVLTPPAGSDQTCFPLTIEGSDVLVDLD